MPGKSPLPALSRLLAVAAMILAGCSHAYVNPNIANPADAKKQFAADSAICTQEANQDVPPTYGMDRFYFDPTPIAETEKWMGNVVEDDDHLDAYSACMHRRGWRFKKK
ncbi:hypothetical protein [Solidesulfovibrio sp. C21]|uniref:hypothetical protein n=1 Tax=Solidesulfovibrio sp. C21 TaxID=3398613 RepID=UPI0039FCB9C3